MPAELLKVLVVDDEKAYLEDFLSLFSIRSKGKYEVLTANGGEEALQLLQREPVAVIVSDQRMPRMTGAELLAQVARLTPHTVRILLTGYADIEAVIEAVNKGEIYRYVSKDTPLKEIEIIIRQGLDKYRLEELNRQLLSAKKRLLKSLAVQENLSVVGTFGQQIHQRMEALVMNLFNYVFEMRREGGEQAVLAEFQKLQGALSRLRELSSFSERLQAAPSGTERCDLNLLVQEAVDRAKRVAKSCEFQLELGKLPEIPVHRYSLQRVMKELLENAILFGAQEGKRIQVKTCLVEASPTSDEESVIRLEIHDNGPGIAATEIPKSFAPFYTSFATVAPPEANQPPAAEEYNLGSYYHYGFGLPIAQWIVSLRHNGTVELMSEPGKGTTAVVVLPLLKQ